MSLYKYVAPNLWEYILRDGYIRFTQPSVFNDPFEMQPYFDYVEKESNMRREIKDFLDSDSSKEIWNAALQVNYMSIPAEVKERLTFKHFKEISERILKEHKIGILAELEHGINLFSNKDGQLTATGRETLLFGNKLFGVLSLTEKQDNLLMWAHYADNHQGFVIEFDKTHEWFSQQHTTSKDLPLRSLVSPFSTTELSDEQWDLLEKTARALSPQYNNEEIQDTEESYIGRLLKVDYRTERPCHEALKDITPTDMLLVKSTDWEYEQEWRMLRFLCHSDKVISNDVGGIHLFSLPPLCIKGIIFGCRMPPLMKENISKFLISDKRYSHMKRYKAVMNDKRFQLDIIPNEI